MTKFLVEYQLEDEAPQKTVVKAVSPDKIIKELGKKVKEELVYAGLEDDEVAYFVQGITILEVEKI